MRDYEFWVLWWYPIKKYIILSDEHWNIYSWNETLFSSENTWAIHKLTTARGDVNMGGLSLSDKVYTHQRLLTHLNEFIQILETSLPKNPTWTDLRKLLG